MGLQDNHKVTAELKIHQEKQSDRQQDSLELDKVRKDLQAALAEKDRYEVALEASHKALDELEDKIRQCSAGAANGSERQSQSPAPRLDAGALFAAVDREAEDSAKGAGDKNAVRGRERSKSRDRERSRKKTSRSSSSPSGKRRARRRSRSVQRNHSQRVSKAQLLPSPAPGNTAAAQPQIQRHPPPPAPGPWTPPPAVQGSWMPPQGPPPSWAPPPGLPAPGVWGQAPPAAPYAGGWGSSAP